ncbi:MAG: tetratricopeptide repeat protein [Deltaproteobacteria bacterium]|nr:tetratricopeptide repeat protein [Deltaproteobacteria bacterium]
MKISNCIVILGFILSTPFLSLNGCDKSRQVEGDNTEGKQPEVGELKIRKVEHRLNREGAELVRTGRYREAIEAYRKNLEEFPNNCRSMIGLSVAYKKMGENEKASQYYQKWENVCD